MIIGIIGFIGAGKSTVAGILSKEHGFELDAVAASLKDAIAALFQWDRQLLEGITPESRVWRETIDEWWSERLGIPCITPRWALQHIGTDILRTFLHPDVLIAGFERRLAGKANATSNIVITDLRFPNEVNLVRSLGGVLLRVTRGPDSPESHELHASEVALLGVEVDYLVSNDGTIDDLKDRLTTIVNAAALSCTSPVLVENFHPEQMPHSVSL